MKLNILILTLFLGFISCGFSEKKEGDLVSNIERLEDQDFDGDMILNDREDELGLNDQIADIPRLDLSFGQGYKLKLNIQNDESLEEVIIKDSVKQDDADFSYTYGKNLLWDKSSQNSAKVGRFSGHSFGEISELDSDLIKYDLDNELSRFESQLKIKKLLSKPKSSIESISINIKARLYLNKHPLFKEVRNPVFGIYYYDYKNKKYQVLKRVSLDLVLKENVLEEVSIELSDIPEGFVMENFLKKGEFVYLKLLDYELTELNTSFKNLIKSIKSKTTTVNIFNPYEHRIEYVSTKSGKSFVQVLDTIYKDEYEISGNKLTKLGEFTNNLKSYEQLIEVRDELKKGKWFVYTNEIDQSYLTHPFSPQDSIVLSYITGNKLSNQIEGYTRSYRSVISDTNPELKLGDFGVHSKVSFLIDVNEIWGDEVIKMVDTVRPAPCHGNCPVSDFACVISLRHYTGKKFRAPFKMEYSSNVFSIKVEDKEYSLDQLIEDGIIERQELDDKYLFELVKPSFFFSNREVGRKSISLYTPTFKDKLFNGFKLDSMSGKTGHYSCPDAIMRFAQGNNIPLSVESKDFHKWKHWVNWLKVKRGENKEEVLDFSFSVTGSVTNFYN
ncbi:putative lipoprotein [Bacteriovorax sp. BAL6_X]|uniref:hypothetical protein n=1 Tax=Bacteriovorax sp. BAL6_X TaxID=1201290 RepID=UPI000385EF0B|nr:hypothetical protein [Bacteriovorax sp. BAL6_X]EPZ50885.1 putative lipoprotein [Bacteriovorax sp. BAL6_X]